MAVQHNKTPRNSNSKHQVLPMSCGFEAGTALDFGLKGEARPVASPPRQKEGFSRLADTRVEIAFSAGFSEQPVRLLCKGHYAAFGPPYFGRPRLMFLLRFPCWGSPVILLPNDCRPHTWGNLC